MALIQESIRKPEKAQWIKWARLWWDTGTGFCETVWTVWSKQFEQLLQYLNFIICQEVASVTPSSFLEVTGEVPTFRASSSSEETLLLACADETQESKHCIPTWHILPFHPPIKKKCFWDCRRAWNFEMCQLKSSALSCCTWHGNQGGVALLRGLELQTCLRWALLQQGVESKSTLFVLYLHIPLHYPTGHLLCYFVQYQLLFPHLF